MPNDSLLPSNSTALERSLSLIGDRLPGAAALVRAQWRPEEVDPRLIAWLAWGMSVDLWNDAWSDERKAEVVRQSIRLHRLKGTEEGARRFLELVDAKLVQTVTHRVQTFATPVISLAERNAWLERMPQIRIYLGNDRGKAGADAFASANFAGHAFGRFDAGAAIYGRRATYRTPDGVEVKARRAEVIDSRTTATAVLDRVHIRGEAGPAAFAGGAFAGAAFLSAPRKPAKLVTFALDREYSVTTSALHLETVEPGLKPVDVKYERVSGVGAEGLAAFPGRFVGRRYARPDGAAWLMFDRVYLNDPSVDAPWVRAHSFCGTARLGMQPFRAHMAVDAREPARRRTAFLGRAQVGRSFATPDSDAKARNVYLAARLSKAARDRVLVTTKTRRARQFGDSIPLDGSFRFGTTVRQAI